MKFSINLSGKTLSTVMREVGYAPDRFPSNTGEEKFHRYLRGSTYPRFHIYARAGDDRKTATINLHLDQKQPSYKGTAAHGGEYDGSIVETEASRIQKKGM